MLVALIIGVLRTSDTLGMALAVRGVGNGQPRTVWRDICFRRRDWLVLATVLALLVGLLYARFALGVGQTYGGAPAWLSALTNPRL